MKWITLNKMLHWIIPAKNENETDIILDLIFHQKYLGKTLWWRRFCSTEKRR